MVDVGRVVEHAECDVAGPAGDVKDVPSFAVWAGGEGSARVEGAHKVVFPQAVDSEGHQVVHSVVGGCDGAEDGADWGVAVSLWFQLVRRNRSEDIEILPRDSFSDSGTLVKPKCVMRSCSDLDWFWVWRVQEKQR